MFQPQRTTARRAGFTLVEILVVIAIIAVLVALITPAVMQFLKKGPQVRTATELSQFDGGIQNWRQTMGPKYFPSKLMLCEKYNTYQAIINQGGPNATLAQDSVSFLTSLFPHILDANPAINNQVQWIAVGIDWNNNGVIDNGFVILEGQECLVFFLGGIPAGTSGAAIGTRSGAPQCLGWSTDPRDPAKASTIAGLPAPQTTGRTKPFFEFDSSRLLLFGNTQGAQKGFYSYVDPYGTNKPYAYFSNYGSRNGYNKYTTSAATSDCATLGVVPYFVSTTPLAYLNPETQQIISAGADGTFGPGGVIFSASTASNLAAAARDDQANFSGGGLLMAGGAQ
jgi:prepilin-type N-terminal cleavage/methylation domain-containing protein